MLEVVIVLACLWGMLWCLVHQSSWAVLWGGILVLYGLWHAMGRVFS